MKTMLRSFAILLALALAFAVAHSTTKTWAGGTGTGLNWTTGSNWGGTAPVAGDDVVFNTAGTITFSTMMSSSNDDLNSLTISQGNVTFAYSSSRTVTIGGNAGTDLTIASGSSLTLGTNISLTMASNATGSIAGTLTVNSSRTFDTDGSSVVTTVTGSLINSGTVAGATGKLVFSSGSTYEHAQNGGTIPTATWNSASTCLVTGVTTTLPSGVGGQTLGNLTWNCPSQNNSTALSGTVTVAGNLTIVSTGSYQFRCQNDPVTVNGNFIMTGGAAVISGSTAKNLNVGGYVDISAGATLIVNLTGTSTTGLLQVAGNLSNAGTITVDGTSTVSGIVFNGSGGDQTFSSSGTITGIVNITVNKSSGNVVLSSDLAMNSSTTLTLTSGNISTGSHTLIIPSTGSVSRGNGYVIGNLAKVYSAAGSKTFEVGDNGYSPVTVNADAGTGTFTVKAIQTTHPNAAGGDMLRRYWTLTSSGITQADLTFSYLDADVFGDDANYQLAKYDDGSWTLYGVGSVNEATNTASLNNVTSFSDWTCGTADALPIQMASFAANVVRNNQVEVAWKTVSETNNYGFEIYRKRGDAGEYAKIGFVRGHGTTLAPQSYTYADAGLSFGKYYYRIKQVDLDGKSETFPEMSVTVGVGKFVLAQNYPNPFNPSTLIEFVVPQTGFATMKVYNVLGQEVASLFEGNAEAGKINTARFNASNLPSGLYFYTLRAAGQTDTKWMLLMK